MNEESFLIERLEELEKAANKLTLEITNGPRLADKTHIIENLTKILSESAQVRRRLGEVRSGK